MPDEDSLALRQANQLRTDIANAERELKMIMARLPRMPTRKEPWRAALMRLLGGAAAAVALVEAFTRSCRGRASKGVNRRAQDFHEYRALGSIYSGCL